jgi:hypothetical protein
VILDAEGEGEGFDFDFDDNFNEVLCGTLEGKTVLPMAIQMGGLLVVGLITYISRLANGKS